MRHDYDMGEEYTLEEIMQGAEALYVEQFPGGHTDITTHCSTDNDGIETRTFMQEGDDAYRLWGVGYCPKKH